MHMTQAFDIETIAAASDRATVLVALSTSKSLNVERVCFETRDLGSNRRGGLPP